MKTTKRTYFNFCFVLLAIISWLPFSSVAQTQTLSTSLCGQTSPGSPCPGATTVHLYSFAYNITSGNPTFTGITGFTTSGTYTAADITGFTIYVTTFCAFNTSTPLQTIPAAGPGAHNFVFADPLPAAPSQRYFWITTNFTAGAVPGHTITINIITAAMTVITGTESFGTNTAGGTQTVCTVLPTELISFTAVRDKEKNKITWTTATEINTDFFIVEKSDNGIDFTECGRRKAAGNSNQPLNYHITDDHALAVNLYYRLKQIDLDGLSNYSEIITVNSTELEETEIFPNPAREIIEIKTTIEGPVILRIMSSTGQLQQETLLTDRKADVTELPAGLYLVLITTKNGTQSKRLVKE